VEVPSNPYFKLAIVLFALLALFFGFAQMSRRARLEPSLLLSEAQRQIPELIAGAEAYAKHCAVCHGDQALGLEEARLVFPPEEQKCETCHRPRNPQRWRDMRVTEKSAFSVGLAPALRGEQALVRFADAQSLYEYLKASMPRYAPSSLSDTQYRDLAAFLLAINPQELAE